MPIQSQPQGESHDQFANIGEIIYGIDLTGAFWSLTGIGGVYTFAEQYMMRSHGGEPDLPTLSEGFVNAYGQAGKYLDAGFNYELDPETGEYRWTKPTGGIKEFMEAVGTLIPEIETRLTDLDGATERIAFYLDGTNEKLDTLNDGMLQSALVTDHNRSSIEYLTDSFEKFKAAYSAKGNVVPTEAGK